MNLGKNYFDALRFIDDKKGVLNEIKKTVQSSVVTAIEVKVRDVKISVRNGYENLAENADSLDSRIEKCGLAMQKLRYEIDAQRAILQKADESKTKILGNLAKDAAIDGAKSTCESLIKEVVLGAATGGISIAAEAGKAMAMSLANLVGHGVAEKKLIVNYYLDQGYEGGSLLLTTGYLMIEIAEDLEAEHRGALDGSGSHEPAKFRKPRKLLLGQFYKDQTLRDEKLKLSRSLDSYDELAKLIISGEGENSLHVNLVRGIASDA